MIGLYGPSWPQRIAVELSLKENPPFKAAADTLGAAIRRYEEAFNASISPYDGSWPDCRFEPGQAPKYFVYTGGRFREILVDIHVFRGDDELCPKQDLAFPLEADDIVSIGPLAC